ncbi:voltage-dependent T-type calcium channel subunit alpha-1I-like [Anabas testudineus]|uniref:voltage-dependent T-type calcium channel subunit alpha-1I-like n=1 Tax=Anabas testudineus TaxID=64144 RepID=UPI000E4541CF|nr:voltage-dependent T-type calcium channel subunit alpha-1I-like [Anabas testudineus]
MLVNFISVLTLAIEHYQQPVELTKMIHISNVIFTTLFAVEMSIKLLTLEWEYFSDRNNLFDFVIVFTGLWDIMKNTDSKLSVLRTFRLLRFVRLVHFFPYMKRQLTVLRRTIEGAAPLFRLLFFGIFIAHTNHSTTCNVTGRFILLIQLSPTRNEIMNYSDCRFFAV